MNAISREFLAERDAKIFQLRRGGMPSNEIAKRVGISPRAVTAAVSRQLAKMNRDAQLAYPEVQRLELERLDALQAAIWPQTQPRLETMPDGTTFTVGADPKAIDTVLKIMASRQKLLGLDTVQVAVTVSEEQPMRAVLHGSTPEGDIIDVDSTDPAEEARELISLMRSSGILRSDDPALAQFAGVLEAPDVVDAELVEEEDEDGQP